MTRLIPVLVAALMLIGGCVSFDHKAQMTVRQSIAHLEDSAVSIETRNGRVEVRAGSTSDEVQVEARVTCTGATSEEARDRLAETRIEVIRATDGTLTIRPVFAGGERRGDGAGILVSLPGAHGVHVGTSNGRVVVEGATDSLDVTTSNGSVTVEGHDGPASLRTSNGVVRVDDLRGALSVDTSNGSVRISGLAGRARVTTSNGSVDMALHDDQAGPVDVRTSNGSIDVAIGAAFGGTLTMSTSNGSVSAVDTSGRVRETRMSKNSGKIVLGAGDGRSTLATSNGRIRVAVR